MQTKLVYYREQPIFLSHLLGILQNFGNKYNGRCKSQHKLQDLYMEGVQYRDQ